MTTTTQPGAYGIEEDPNGKVQCGECGKRWAEDITPAGRCPWEWNHDDEQPDEYHRVSIRIRETTSYTLDVPAHELAAFRADPREWLAMNNWGDDADSNVEDSELLEVDAS